MIPIPHPEKTDLDTYCKSVITYISSTANGNIALELINATLNKIEKGLTLYKLLHLETYQLDQLKSKFNYYKINILPKLIKPCFENPQDTWSQTYNRENIFYNKIITFEQMIYFYNEYMKINGFDFMEGTGIKVCPYCNLNKISNGSVKRTSEFDHFIPKAAQEKYPLFALCYYNLIPSCKTCNRFKSSDEIKILNPYDNQLKNNTFYFVCKIGKKIDKVKIDLKTNEKDKIFVDALEGMKAKDKLDLEHLYSDYTDIVQDLWITSNLIKNKDYLNSVMMGYKDLHVTDITFRKYILKRYDTEKDFLLQPLSKLTKDIAEQFHIFDYI